MRRKTRANADPTSTQSARGAFARTPAPYDASLGLREIVRREKEKIATTGRRVERSDPAGRAKEPDLRSVAQETVRRAVQTNGRLAYKFLQDTGGVYVQSVRDQVFDQIAQLEPHTRAVLGLQLLIGERKRVFGIDAVPEEFKVWIQVARDIDRESRGHSMEFVLSDPGKWLEWHERFYYENTHKMISNRDSSPGVSWPWGTVTESRGCKCGNCETNLSKVPAFSGLRDRASPF